MAEVADLKKKRTILKSKATRFKNFIEGYEASEETIFELETRIDKLDLLWSEYSNIQDDIDAYLPLPENTEREQFENAFFQTQSIAKRKRAQFYESRRSVVSRPESAMTVNTVGGGISQARLPIITLPTFDGSYEKWQGFYDTFLAVVDRNVALDAITKFHYLQSALTGSAKEYIDSFEVTEQNYPIVLELLKKRYHNSRLIINYHVKQLFELPMVTRESATSLRVLADGLQKHTRILEQLKEPVDTWDTLLLYLASTRLDNTTKREWELKTLSERVSKLKDFIAFLELKCQMLEVITPQGVSSNSNFKMVSSQGMKRDNKVLAHLSTGDSSFVCVICRQDHRIYSCSVFRNLSIDDRREKVKALELCFNCLGVKHTARECKSNKGCRICNSSHHSLLHKEKDSTVKATNSYHIGKINETQCITNANHEETPTMSVNMFSNKNTNEKILSTAVIYVKDNLGQLVRARALLDNGSMANFMTEELCKKLNLKKKNIMHAVSGINLTQTSVMSCTLTTIVSIKTDYRVRAEFLVTNNISHCIPTTKISLDRLSIPEHVKLADPNFHDPQPIDLLLGTAIFWDSMEAQQIRPGQGHPVLQLTKFGWILGGYLTFPEAHNQKQTTTLFCGLSTDKNLDDHMKRFWEINEIPVARIKSAEELECESNFSETFRRAEDGRFEVSLPLKKDVRSLGESRSGAEKRLLSMERRFRKDQNIKLRYQEYMDEFLELGHMTRILDQETGFMNYLPHHAVIKESSTTTKVRVVLDGSFRTTSGISLNDCVMVGPVVQQELFLIILRFRQHKFVVTGDIVKMYRQIWVKPEHRNLQCILWRKDPDQSMITYQLNTVTFGVASSPYLATRCLLQLSEECRNTHPLASRVIREDFYVDDMLSGGETEEEIDAIVDEVKAVLQSAGFELQKIYSNKIEKDMEVRNHDLTEIKTLGLKWQTEGDYLTYESNYECEEKIVTKRMILSVIAQVFDPLGLIGPFVVRSKILLQGLWKLKIGWDVPIPTEVAKQWILYCEQLKQIKKIKIPRHVLVQSPQEIELHGFCDSSQVAYGACIYLRSISNDGSVMVRLVAARSRVSPMKTVSLPRLELCGAVLLADLHHKVKESLTVKIKDSWFWSDSMVALSWIKADPSRWHIFVGNRVTEIQQWTSPEQWNHVRTDQNPADLISRGMELDDLERSSLWWNGPSWLSGIKDDWPHEEIAVKEIPEEKKAALTFIAVERDFSIFRRYSSWNRLCRITAYCLRFSDNLKRKRDGFPLIKDHLSAEELEGARISLLKLHQEEEFSRELADLRHNRPINSSSKILTYNPFLDDQGLMRVGGRLVNAPISYSQKFPIILSTKHMLTVLIIRNMHYKNLHAGAQFLKGVLREMYWIISANCAIRRVLRRCVLCFRLRSRSPTQLMGNLPAERVTSSRAFAHTGLDYAGPFKIKLSRNVTGKAYLCVFVCMATKAVHLELASDLSTNTFLNALKRFIARRGKCLSIQSDNGLNFIGAKNELQDIIRSLLNESESKAKISEFVAENSISWKCIPPYSPHMGGLWEACVKSAKSHLRTVLNDTPLTFEEFYTLLTQVESIMNSRPLCSQSTDPYDLTPLTPGHFLIGSSFTSILEKNHLDIQLNRLNRFQLLCQMQQSFWKRWSCEYLTQMQSRFKWKREVENVKIGQMIVIRDDNAPPLRWRLGRIVELHSGNDGRVRVVSARTSLGIVKRALPKICVLPIDDEND
ncbi:uncharacterized protein LOC127284864 [Leptopilina boulardi]|uniref:uncharacterized protein LOC127284864 n=1 Tax=Leptopilina boulardi TaxID=63433 RepID=UPI0021F61E54|nr:uncharacterized protein LOC127284864 [Leptopilina boulardi]